MSSSPTSPTASAPSVPPSVPPSSPLSSVPSDHNSEDTLVDVQPSEVEFLETAPSIPSVPSADNSKDELVDVQPSEVQLLETAPSIPPVWSDDNSEDELVDVQPSEVTFLEILAMKRTYKNGNNLVMTFKVEIRGKLCVLKIFKDLEYGPDYFMMEYDAYRLLRKEGFCKRGLVPNFYGTIQNIDVNLWPQFSQYQNHKYRPSAVLMEYVPDAEQLSLDNFSEDNIERLVAIVAEFHEVGLRHGDIFPRNMMVVQGTPRDRVFWLDFDVSQVVDRKTCTDREKKLLKEESQWMENFATALVTDAKNGKLKVAWHHFYDGPSPPSPSEV